MAPDQPHECPYLRQAQAGAFFAFGREVWIKDFSRCLCGHTLTVVRDANAHVNARNRQVGSFGFHLMRFSADLNLAAVGHRVARIDDKVEDRGVEFQRINEALRNIGCEIKHDADARSGAVFQKQLKVPE